MSLINKHDQSLLAILFFAYSFVLFFIVIIQIDGRCAIFIRFNKEETLLKYQRGKKKATTTKITLLTFR